MGTIYQIAKAVYYVADQVGSARAEVSFGSWPLWSGYFDPFGVELDANATPNNFKFTGQERDTESGNDFFKARMYASSQGRMLSPDPGWLSSSSLSNPQSWNQYTYVRNNPLTFTDPSGMDCAYNPDNSNGVEECDGDSNPDPPSWLDGDPPQDAKPRIRERVDVSGTPDDVPVTLPTTYDPSIALGGQIWAQLAAPSNPKCSTAIMQPQYTAIFGQMGNQLKINPLFVMSTALQESGWNLAHVYGTNSSSHGQPLNNLFGMTNAGGNNIAYPSVQASAQAWIADWGSYLSGQPQTIKAYAAALNSNPKHMYNSNAAYPGQLAARYKQLVSATAACGTTF